MPQVFATCLSAKGQRERPGGEAAREADEKSTSSRRSRSWQSCPTRERYTGADCRIISNQNQRSGLCTEGDLARVADCFDAPMRTSICRERGGALEHRTICTPISVPANANLFKHSPALLSSLLPGHSFSTDNPKTADNLSALAGSV